MAISPALFSKASDEWRTPLELFTQLHREFGFHVDCAATPENALVDNYFIAAHDTLTTDWSQWGEVFWLNPPYSQVKAFMAKAAAEAAKGCTVVCLVPARTDTQWWHQHVWDRSTHKPRTGVEVRLLMGRVAFRGADGQPMRDKRGRVVGAPFPSAVVVFRPVL